MLTPDQANHLHDLIAMQTHAVSQYVLSCHNASENHGLKLREVVIASKAIDFFITSNTEGAQCTIA